MIEDKQFFVGIGAAKAGTTWLHNFFLNHPQVCVSPLKEVHFFDAVHVPHLVNPFPGYARELANLANQLGKDNEETVFNRIRLLANRLKIGKSEEAYKDYFDEICADHHTLFGEITPSYSMLGEAGYNAINALFPGAKFILLMRNPVDRFWSQVRFTETIHPEFSPPDEIDKALKNPQIMERGNYKHTLESLEASTVPAENVYVSFYEDFFASESDELKRLTDFLNIEQIKANQGHVVNRSPEYTMDQKTRRQLTVAMLDQYHSVQERFKTMPESWLQDLASV